jgi:hypothetical protein
VRQRDVIVTAYHAAVHGPRRDTRLVYRDEEDWRRAPRDQTEAYKQYLSGYDRDKDPIQAAPKRLIEANMPEPDGAVIVSRVAIALEAATTA